MSLFSKKAYVGLDIGQFTVKAVQVERTPSGWHIARSTVTPTPVDTVRDGVVIDPSLLGIAIKNMLKEAHIHATSAAIAISGGTVVVRPVRIPKMAESSLRKSIRYEASRYVPNSIEDSYIEFEIMGDADATNMDVIIAAAPKELIDSRIHACENAGLDVEHVEVATFAAYRSVVEADLTQTWTERTLGLIDIGSSITNLGVISNGAFSMTRAIPAGGHVLTDALKSYFKLSDEDAESGKSQLDIRGLMDETAIAENPPLRVLHTHVDDLVREVRRSINYWQSQQSEGATAKRMDSIILVGGGANMLGLAEYFQHKLGIPTVAYGLFDNPRFTGAHSETDRGLELAVAVGLAMGLAPAKAVVRSAKPAPLAVTSSEAPLPRSPRPPKPPKSKKGKTFKVTRQVEATGDEAELPQASERAEVAASASPTEYEALQSVPQAFMPISPATEPEVTGMAAPDAVHAETSTLGAEPVPAWEAETPVSTELISEPFDLPATVTESVATANEQAALLADMVQEPSRRFAQRREPTEFKSDVQASAPIIETDDASFSTTATPVSEMDALLDAPAVTSAPVAKEVTTAPTSEMDPLRDAPVATPTPVAKEVTTTPTSEMDALLDVPVVTHVPSAKVEKPSLFARFAKSKSPAKSTVESKTESKPEAPAERAKPPKVAKATVNKVSELETKMTKPASSASEMDALLEAPTTESNGKPTVAKAEKSAKATKEPRANKGDVKQKLKGAVSWMFGSPTPEIAKPTGILTPPRGVSEASIENEPGWEFVKDPATKGAATDTFTEVESDAKQDRVYHLPPTIGLTEASTEGESDFELIKISDLRPGELSHIVDIPKPPKKAAAAKTAEASKAKPQKASGPKKPRTTDATETSRKEAA